MAPRNELILLLSLPAMEPTPDSIVLTRKIIAGLDKYAELWNGPVHAIFPPGATKTDNLDEIAIDKSALRFSAQILPFSSSALRERIRGAALVSGGPHHLLNGMAQHCRSIHVPYVYTTEYSLLTRWQIIRAEVSNPLLRLRKYWWEWRQERCNRQQVLHSAGIQCNGVPTYNAYASLARDTLLYFDSRISAAMLAREDGLRARHERYVAGRKLQLAFSGRLNRMKGADHLPRVAAALKQRGIQFVLHIFGAGESEAAMQREVHASGLENEVLFHGVKDFQRELVPFLQNEIDLFVCCHRQGDPSCTYIETLACGVPIAGYGNEALASLLRRVDAGWVVPMNQAAALAETIARVAQDKAALQLASRNALQFAKANTFEKTFRLRIEQMQRLARRSSNSPT